MKTKLRNICIILGLIILIGYVIPFLLNLASSDTEYSAIGIIGLITIFMILAINIKDLVTYIIKNLKK